jgi:hypothetical protein
MSRLPSRVALLAAVAGGAACVLGAFLDPDRFFPAYLVALLLWTGVATGCLAIGLLHHLVGGRWGRLVRTPIWAGARTLPYLALLFLPLLLGLRHLYPWARADAVSLTPAKRAYLNPAFFTARMFGYLAIWWILARWLVRRRGTPSPRARLASGWGLVVLAFTITFAAIDWCMSIEPHWYSTMLGLLFCAGALLGGFSVAVVVTGRARRGKPSERFIDIGNLLLTFVMVWAYFSFSQYLIIWSGNLPEEIPWYVHRSAGGWALVAGALALFHFAVPFLLLLSRDFKRRPERLAWLAVALLALRWLDLVWTVKPSFPSSVDWLDVAAPIAVGGFWAVPFLRGIAPREAA